MHRRRGRARLGAGRAVGAGSPVAGRGACPDRSRPRRRPASGRPGQGRRAWRAFHADGGGRPQRRPGFPVRLSRDRRGLPGLADPSWLGWWLLRDGLYRIAAGVTVGAGVGWCWRGWSTAPRTIRRGSTGLACVALCVFLIAYGAAELAGGYGFIAAFVCAVVLRGAAHDHDYNGVLFDFVEEVEHAAMVLVLFLLGGVALLVLPHLTWGGAAVGRRPRARRPPRGRLARPGRARLGRRAIGWPPPSTASAGSARCTTWPMGSAAPISPGTSSSGRLW